MLYRFGALVYKVVDGWVYRLEGLASRFSGCGVIERGGREIKSMCIWGLRAEDSRNVW